MRNHVQASYAVRQGYTLIVIGRNSCHDEYPDAAKRSWKWCKINALKKFVHVRCSGMYQRARAPIRVKRILGRCACV